MLIYMYLGDFIKQKVYEISFFFLFFFHGFFILGFWFWIWSSL